MAFVDAQAATYIADKRVDLWVRAERNRRLFQKQIEFKTRPQGAVVLIGTDGIVHQSGHDLVDLVRLLARHADFLPAENSIRSAVGMKGAIGYYLTNRQS